jgi:hypothetical protein
LDLIARLRSLIMVSSILVDERHQPASSGR